ncbi:MAG TPA: nucleotide sugar dehydrogenase [Candidatus Paceibacterota bacterium]|nr:nucleotide sugar dehydrogenase [Candidatus Paceibacterota bacterium]
MEQLSEKTIAVVGLGYVGLPLAVLADQKKYSVIGIDKNLAKIESLRQGVMPFEDKRLEKQFKKTSIAFTDQFEEIKRTSIVVICVPTPVRNDHVPDLEPVKSAARGIGAHLQKGQLVILESTVNPGVCEEILIPLLEETSGLVAGADFQVAHCPERVNPGDPNWHVGNIPRVVGSYDDGGLDRALQFYRSLVKAEIFPMHSLKEAEAVKIVENSFRDINIAFVNELAMSFSKLGIDVVNVIQGASTKPFAFMPHFPSCGVGGHCIPVDPYYLIAYAKKNGFYHDFLSLARKINNHMPEFTVERLVYGLNEKRIGIKGATVAVLGLAYKPNVDDCRESPSFTIIKHLEYHGASIRTFDPYVPNLSTEQTLEQALDGADAALIATAHDQFKTLRPADLNACGVAVVVDGCNCLPKDEFLKANFVYKGIGR